MKNNEGIKSDAQETSSSAWDELSSQPFQGEAAKSYEQIQFTTAINIHDSKEYFMEGGEILPDRKPDSICRKAKPNKIPGVTSHDEVMAFSPDLSEPLHSRFHLNADDFPIFAEQGEMSGSLEHRQSRTLNIAETANRYVSETIATIEEIEDSDLVIYLDKSARPASWFVNEFWEEFSEKERPAEANLAIDRMQWFPQAGLEVNDHGEMKDLASEKMRKATFNDFLEGAGNIPPSVFANIRALFIPGGVDTEDPEAIMKMSTGLEGKKITIIDEVNNSGSTINIAEWLIQQAIPEIGETAKHTFWNPASLLSESGSGETQMGCAPVWYDPIKHDDWSGRGVLDINTGYFKDNYEANQDNYTRAQMLGSIVLGEPMDIEQEPGGRSMQLQKEIRKMHEEYRKGHILPSLAQVKSDELADRLIEGFEAMGMKIAPLSGDRLDDKDKYVSLLGELKEV